LEILSDDLIDQQVFGRKIDALRRVVLAHLRDFVRRITLDH
jgi:hypothetical protein